MGLSCVLECPVCDSHDVRVSFNRPPYEFFYRWQGLQRYRCRECRSIFRIPLRPGETFAKKPARRRRTHRIRRYSNSSPQWARKSMEAALFLMLLFVFYAALKNVGFTL